MRIAVDTRHLGSDRFHELSIFTKSVFYHLAVLHPEHFFIFLAEDVCVCEDSFSNVLTVTITPKPTNFLLYKWWYDLKVPRVMRKMKADVFIGSYGICSLTAGQPQVLIVGDLSFTKKELYFPKTGQSYYKKYTRHFIKKAKRVLTLSTAVREELIDDYKVNKQSIEVIGSGADPSYQPVGWEQRELIKSRVAGDCEYFVFIIHRAGSLLNGLKAFSIFKKWQKTNMKLVIPVRDNEDFDETLEQLNSYKYRGDVFITKVFSETERADVIAGSYAVIFLSQYEGFAQPVLQAIKCAVPVITCNTSSMSEIAGDAALYADPIAPAGIADQMKRIFKDEQLRNNLIENGKLRSVLFDWHRTAELLWQVLEQVVSR